MTVYVVLDIFSPEAGMKDGEGDDARVYTDNNAKWTDSTRNNDGEGAKPLDVVYDKCYSSGNKCPGNFRQCESKHCNIQKWKKIIADLKATEITTTTGGETSTTTHTAVTVKVLGNIDACTKDCKNDLALPAADDSDWYRSAASAGVDIQAYKDSFGSTKEFIDGFFFSELDNDDSVSLQSFANVANGQKELEYFTVLSTGEWLKEGAVDADGVKTSEVIGAAGADGVATNVDVVITLTDKLIGEWNPYAWYPTYAPKTWGAIVYEVDTSNVDCVANKLYDRGYGYIYLQEGDHEAKFGEEGTANYFKDVLVAIAGVSANGANSETCTGNEGVTPGGDRRLQTVDTGVATYTWGCDSTGLECKPVCFMEKGFMTNNVADSKCAGVAPDPCGCKCFFDAAWTCSGDNVVCQATNSLTLERSNVGGLLCASRGSKKPTIDSFTKRVNGECENKLVAGFYPSETCMAKAQKTKEDREAALKAAAEEAARAASSTAAPADGMQESTEIENNMPEMLIESFAAVATVAAVAALA
jgi:hypothetical protein